MTRMNKFLRDIKVIQERIKPDFSEVKQFPKTQYRVNPYNPLSYVTVITVFIIGVIMFGFVGIWEEVPKGNPFKWS